MKDQLTFKEIQTHYQRKVKKKPNIFTINTETPPLQDCSPRQEGVGLCSDLIAGSDRDFAMFYLSDEKVLNPINGTFCH